MIQSSVTPAPSIKTTIMEGQDIHDYLQDEHGFNDLQGSSSWSTPHEQQYVQDQYRFPMNQGPFDHYDLSQQPSYNHLTYTNQPYVSQFQHNDRSNGFGHHPYTMDPSIQAPDGYGQDHAFHFVYQGLENSTISPQSLQYNLPQTHSPNEGIVASPFQGLVADVHDTYSQKPQNLPRLYHAEASGIVPQRQEQNRPTIYQQDASGPQPQHQQTASTPVQYPTLPTAAQSIPKHSIATAMAGDTTQPRAGAQHLTAAPIPPPLRIVHPQILAQRSSSTHLTHAPFVSWDDTPLRVTSGSNSKQSVAS